MLCCWSGQPQCSVLCAARSERLRINPQDQPLMLAEPSFQPREARERVVQRVFEGCSAPALFLAKNAALSSYATGRQTSLVVDMGYEGTVGAQPPLLPFQLSSMHMRQPVCITSSPCLQTIPLRLNLSWTSELLHLMQRHTTHRITLATSRCPQISSFSIASFSCCICDFSWLPSFVVTEQEITCTCQEGLQLQSALVTL